MSDKLGSASLPDDVNQQIAIDKELMVLRKLASQMRVNVETRSRSPKWLVHTLDKIAKVQNIPEVEPGIRYGATVKYE